MLVCKTVELRASPTTTPFVRRVSETRTSTRGIRRPRRLPFVKEEEWVIVDAGEVPPHVSWWQSGRAFFLSATAR